MPKEEARPTQEFVDIDYVQNGIIALKSGALRQILLVSGMNFDLKSEEEQQIIIASFQNFLNSLRFSLQFFTHSRRVNIESYLNRLMERKNAEQNELLQNQIEEYINFIKSFVGENKIMNKAFFVVVPFDPLTVPGAAVGKRFFGLFGKKETAASREEKENKFREHAEQLSQRVTQVVNGLLQTGLRAVPLQDEEIMDLFYNLYNPESVEKKGAVPRQ